MMSSRLRVPVAALLLAPFAWPAVAAAQQPPPATVEVQQAHRQSLAAMAIAPGTVVSRNDARIASEIAGRLIEVAEVGRAVEAGEVIARIDDRTLRLQLQDDIATIRRLEANFAYLERQVARLEQLAEQNNAARDQLDESRRQLEMAQQDLVRARIARDQTEHRISLTQVQSPFPGRIVERFRQGGEFLPVGGEVVRLVDTHNIEVRARAPLSVATHLIDGMPVTVRDADGHQVESTIRAVIPVGDERSRLIEVRVALDEGTWAIGSPLRVELPNSEPAEVVAVPRDALILRQNRTYLFKLLEDNSVEQVSVQTGIGNGDYIEVRGDVAAGDRVVVRGGERLRPGQPVQVIADG